MHILGTNRFNKNGIGCVAFKGVRGFPFPSTGRSFRTLRCLSKGLFECTRSFHSLRTGRSFRTKTAYEAEADTNAFTFLFPSTGKVFRADSDLYTYLFEMDEFPFPSNGKHLLNSLRKNGYHHKHWTVSIPFNRERFSEHSGRRISSPWDRYVSIPFKRETLSEHIAYHYLITPNGKFRFPSTGKVFQNFLTSQISPNCLWTRMNTETYSIFWINRLRIQ